jgi:hypothetical protein
MYGGRVLKDAKVPTQTLTNPNPNPNSNPIPNAKPIAIKTIANTLDTNITIWKAIANTL